jgi:hypothetical protein
MSRIHRLVLLAVLAFTLGLAMAPAQASPVVTPGLTWQCGVTESGTGTTDALALDYALDKLRDRMFISRYTVVYRGCVEIGIEPNTLTSCLVNVTACGFLHR